MHHCPKPTRSKIESKSNTRIVQDYLAIALAAQVTGTASMPLGIGRRRKIAEFYSAYPRETVFLLVVHLPFLVNAALLG